MSCIRQLHRLHYYQCRKSNFKQKLLQILNVKFSTSEKQSSVQKQPSERTDAPGFHLQDWSMDVSPFGKLIADVPFSVKIVPINANECPTMDRAVFSFLVGVKWENLSLNKLSRTALESLMRDTFSTDVRTHGDEIVFHAKQNKRLKEKDASICDISCLFYLPIKFGIDVQVRGIGDLYIEGMESEKIEAFVNSGLCTIKNVKGGNIKISSAEGDIVSTKVLQGNSRLHTYKGDIRTDKIQGQKFTAITDGGNIFVQSLYGEKSEFNVRQGSVTVGSCHGNVNMNILDGDLRIDSLDGNLKGVLNSGSIKAHMTRLESVDLVTDKGNIDLTVDPNLGSQLDLQGNSISIDAQAAEIKSEKISGQERVLGHINEKTDGLLKAHAQNGKISLGIKEWFATMTNLVKNETQ